MSMDIRAWARVVFDGQRIEGDDGQHLALEQLDEALASAETSFVEEGGTLEAIVVRCADGARAQPASSELTIEGGLAGDRWATGRARPGDQVSMMNLDVAAAIANGQSIALFGDNLFTRLDVRAEALPVGARLRVGGATLEVSEKPHKPCGLFRARFGDAAFQRANEDYRLRGVYLTVIESGAIAIGDPVLHA